MKVFSGIISSKEEEKSPHQKRMNLLEQMDSLSESDLGYIHTLNFEDFFAHTNSDTIYIFPFKYGLYCLLFRGNYLFESINRLKYNEVDNYGKKTPKEEIMTTRIQSGELFQIMQMYFSHEFFLYEIPFYFISHIREAFYPRLYGRDKGEWKILTHESLNLRLIPLEFNVYGDISLRPYQQNAYSEWRRNSYFGTIAMATGGGKTLLGIYAIKDLALTTLIVVPTLELMEQWKKELIEKLNISPENIGFFSGDKKSLKPIEIATYNSLEIYITLDEKEKKELSPSEIQRREKIATFLQDYYSLLILDEAHHIPAPKFRRIALHSKSLYRLALSATTERFDENESLLYFCAGKKIFELDYIDLCAEGWVVPFFYNYIPVLLNDNQIDRYRSYKQDLVRKKRITFFNEQKLHKILKIVYAHNQLKHPILIFTSFISDCEQIYDSLSNIGIKVGVVLSEKNNFSDESRNSTLSKFKSGEINVIITTTVLDEGINVPECVVGIIVSGSSQERQMIQRIGRIVRTSAECPEKVGYIYEIVSESNELVNIDFLNHLTRNRMINVESEVPIEDVEYEIADERYWILKYHQINKYAQKRLDKYDLQKIDIQL